MITLDGVRWQEFFGGADRDYFKRDAQGSGGAPERRFWRDTPVERRALVMPFVWSTVARQGQIVGDPATGSRAHLTNGLWFSYPGYNELLAGLPDPRIDSNAKVGRSAKSPPSLIVIVPLGTCATHPVKRGAHA